MISTTVLPRTCLWCKASLEGRQSTARVCSDRCRKAMQTGYHPGTIKRWCVWCGRAFLSESPWVFYCTPRHQLLEERAVLMLEQSSRAFWLGEWAS